MSYAIWIYTSPLRLSPSMFFLLPRYSAAIKEAIKKNPALRLLVVQMSWELGFYFSSQYQMIILQGRPAVKGDKNIS